MACGCQGGTTGEQWEVVYADGTVSNPMTKSEATAWSNQVGGSWIREAGAVAAK
jgi:hypothetical protein